MLGSEASAARSGASPPVMIAGMLTVIVCKPPSTSRVTGRGYHRRYQVGTRSALPQPKIAASIWPVRSCRCSMACLPHRTSRGLFGVDDGLEQLGDCKRFDIGCCTSFRSPRSGSRGRAIAKSGAQRSRCFASRDDTAIDFIAFALLRGKRMACSTAIFMGKRSSSTF